jgi:Uma2 family endonuclease
MRRDMLFFMGLTQITVGPQDHGKRMSLEDFDHAQGREGHLYELSRGVITVTDVPNYKHLAQIHLIRRTLYVYSIANPGRINAIASGSDCKVLLWELRSERHPDLAIYQTTAPDDEEIWSTWIPELVIEVVSPGSETRDYDQKPEEYLAFGVMEYWIVDAAKEEVLAMRRSGGKWAKRVLKPGEKYKTRLLPGFEFDVAAVFAAARSA